MESKKSNTKRYGLIGRNIAYSFSRGYFKQKFETENLHDCSYENFDLKQIEELKNVFAQNNICGLNVTTPYKREVIPFLDRLSPAAEEMNAVNTIKFHHDGSISGHNTDVYGFEKSLLEIINKTPKKSFNPRHRWGCLRSGLCDEKIRNRIFLHLQKSGRKFNQLRSCG